MIVGLGSYLFDFSVYFFPLWLVIVRNAPKMTITGDGLPMTLVLLELNELNFDHVQYYIDRGDLPNFSRKIATHGVSQTVSEQLYEELEPWIQWVTAHTGMSLAEHGVFRLGDILNHDLEQIWEELERSGYSVGAISPMNAKNRLKNAAFFVPDPWTPAELTAEPSLKKLYAAVAQAVNDNAQSRLEFKSKLWLMVGAAKYARPSNYSKYITLAAQARSKPWTKAMFLDLLLADIFIGQTKKMKPDFATLFLNAAAHIQHHYMFSSAAYPGNLKNPDWYVGKDDDPVFDVYSLYDRILGQVYTSFPKARVMLATGLHQDPHTQLTYYWRFKDHQEFLEKVKVPFERVEPRMSRDFLIVCKNSDDALRAESLLNSAKAEDGLSLFSIDNRGSDLFVELSYPHEISDNFSYSVGGRNFNNLNEDVSFVAIKNGQHNGIGYFLDSGAPKDTHPKEFPLKALPDVIKAALAV